MYWSIVVTPMSTPRRAFHPACARAGPNLLCGGEWRVSARRVCGTVKRGSFATSLHPSCASTIPTFAAAVQLGKLRRFWQTRAWSKDAQQALATGSSVGGFVLRKQLVCRAASLLSPVKQA